MGEQNLSRRQMIRGFLLGLFGCTVPVKSSQAAFAVSSRDCLFSPPGRITMYTYDGRHLLGRITTPLDFTRDVSGV